MISILFDLDDTLYSREDPFCKAFQKDFGQLIDAGQQAFKQPVIAQSGAESGTDYSSTVPLNSINDTYIHNLYRAFVRYGYDLFEDSMQGRVTMEEMYIDRIRKTVRLFGCELSDEEALRFQSHYVWEQEHISLSETMKGVLTLCKDRASFVGIVSNGESAHQRMKFDALGLDRWIAPEHFLPTGDIGVSKPDPAALMAAQSKWSLIPEQTWYIGDSLKNDVECASSLGWHTIWLRRHCETDEVVCGKAGQIQPDRTSNSEEELLNILEKIL